MAYRPGRPGLEEGDQLIVGVVLVLRRCAQKIVEDHVERAGRLRIGKIGKRVDRQGRHLLRRGRRLPVLLERNDLLLGAIFKNAKIALRQALNRLPLAVGYSNVFDNPPGLFVQHDAGLRRLSLRLRAGRQQQDQGKKESGGKRLRRCFHHRANSSTAHSSRVPSTVSENAETRQDALHGIVCSQWA